MPQKKVRTTLSIDPELQESLKQYVEARGEEFISTFICEVLEKLIKVPPDEEVVLIGKPANVTQLLLRIPAGLQGDDLKKWLGTQAERIYTRLSNS